MLRRVLLLAGAALPFIRAAAAANEAIGGTVTVLYAGSLVDLMDHGIGPAFDTADRGHFLASLTVPEKDLWVNLSPYEKDRIVPESFGQTAMGRDLLAEDYMLKQITASLIYPEDKIGKKFWERMYEAAVKKWGTTNIPVNTFNKVWIVPEKAVVYENAQAGTAYVVEAKLKVMLEQDYLSMSKHVYGGVSDINKLRIRHRPRDSHSRTHPRSQRGQKFCPIATSVQQPYFGHMV